MRLLVTHLRTPKNEEVIVPNSSIVSTEVVNYSIAGPGATASSSTQRWASGTRRRGGRSRRC